MNFCGSVLGQDSLCCSNKLLSHNDLRIYFLLTQDLVQVEYLSVEALTQTVTTIRHCCSGCRMEKHNIFKNQT